MVAAPLLDSSSGCAWTHMSRSRSDTWGTLRCGGLGSYPRMDAVHPLIREDRPDRGPVCRCPALLPAPPDGGWSASLGRASSRSASSSGGAFGTTSGSVRPEVTGYRVESDTSVVVEYDLHRPAGVAVRVPGQRARRRSQPGGHRRGRRARAGVRRRCTGRSGCARRCAPCRRRRLVHPVPAPTPWPGWRRRPRVCRRGRTAWRSARLGRLYTSHLGSGSDMRRRNGSHRTRARCRSTEAAAPAGRAPPMIQE